MLTGENESFILKHACVPEHIPSYASAISGGEPFLISNYLCYLNGTHLIFVGYPLGGPFYESKLREGLSLAIERLSPKTVALISPKALFPSSHCTEAGSDEYYRLDLASFNMGKNARNMVERASTVVKVERGEGMGKEHEGLISDFLKAQKVERTTENIFEKIPSYVSQSKTALILSARGKDGTLVAFDVADLASVEYAFYQFNFNSRERHVPGASDLLLSEIVKIAGEEGKKYINLGLGIRGGVRRFKEKWGGRPFLKHEFCLYSTGGPDFGAMSEEMF